MPAPMARSMLARKRRPAAKWLLLIPPLLFGLAYLDRVEFVIAGDGQEVARQFLGGAIDYQREGSPGAEFHQQLLELKSSTFSWMITALPTRPIRSTSSSL